MAGVTSINLVEHALLVSIQDDITDTEILELQDRLSTKISENRVDGVILDISALEIVDTFVGRVIAQLAGISRLLAADTYVVGMRPTVASTYTPSPSLSSRRSWPLDPARATPCAKTASRSPSPSTSPVVRSYNPFTDAITLLVNPAVALPSFLYQRSSSLLLNSAATMSRFQ